MGIYNTNQQWTTYRILDATILDVDVADAAAIGVGKLNHTALIGDNNTGTISWICAAGSASAGAAGGITTGAGAGSNNVGGTLTLTAGASIGSGTGAKVDINAGAGGTTGIGGAVEITAGAAGGGNKAGGAIDIDAGAGQGTEPGGAVLINAGAAGSTGTGGAVTITSGTATAGAGGAVGITASPGVGGTNVGGAVTITAGAGISTGAGGDIQLTPGDSPAGTSGSVLVGANAAGHDVTFYGAVTLYKAWWDASGDTNGAFYFGADDYGVDVTFYGQSASAAVTWDASADDLIWTGVARAIIGTSGVPLALTVGSPILSVYSTCATTDSVAQPVLFNTVMTGAGGLGGRVRVNLDADVTLGSYANAFKASIDLKTSGGTTGLLSVICAEMTMATGNISGTYAAIELEMTYGATNGALPKPCFIYANVSGTACTYFDTYGDFVTFGTGFTPGAGGMFGAGTSTLRIGTGTLGQDHRYIPLSTAEATFTSAYPVALSYAGVALQLTGTATIGIGTAGLPVTTAGTSEKWLEVYANTTATSGTHSCLYAISDSSGNGTCSARAVEGWLTISGNITGNAYPAAIYARLTLTGEINAANAFIQAADIRMEDGTPTQTMTAFDECSVAIIQSMILDSDMSGMHSQILRLANNGSAQWRSIIGINANEKVTYLFRFNGCNSGGCNLISVPGNGKTIVHGGLYHAIKCRIEDLAEDVYLIASSAPVTS